MNVTDHLKILLLLRDMRITRNFCVYVLFIITEKTRTKERK